MKNIPLRWKTRAVIAALILTFLVSPKQVERLGDNFQIALPVIALACAATNGRAVDFFARYLVQLGIVHSSKRILGTTAINIRPNGNPGGMPSGHMATATLGASNLVHDCVAGSPWVQGVVILTAGFVGGSRIEVGAHDIWQVLVAALVGWLSDRAFRRVGLLARTRDGWTRLKALFGKGATR